MTTIEMSSIAPNSENVIELTEAGIIGLETLCRLCANRTDHLIPIYEGEGAEHELEMKMNRYLPFKVEQSQSMPMHCCYQCASTVLQWHELVEVSLEANRRLRALQEDAIVHLTQKYPKADEHPVGLEIVSDSASKCSTSHKWHAVSFDSYFESLKSQRTSLLSSNIVKDEIPEELDDDSRDPTGDETKDDVDDMPLSKRAKKKFKCATCKEIFKSEKKWQQHGTRTKHVIQSDVRIRRKQCEITYKIFCDICGYGFTRNCDMVKHRRHVHSDVPAPKKSIRRADDSDVRIKSEPASDECDSVPCSVESDATVRPSFSKPELGFELIVLPKTFDQTSEKTDRAQQRTVAQTDESDYIFEPNNTNSSSSSSVPLRRRKKSEIVPTHFCDLCPKGFTRRYDMRKHRLQVHGDVPNEKEDVRKTKAQKNTELLERCKIEFEGRTHYKCEICDRIVHMSYNFLRHQTVHTGVRAFFCHLCGKSFRMSSGLNRHIKESHYGVKKFPCDECGRCFASKSTRDDHMNIHWGLRPFVCDTCGKSFKSKASLHVHKTFHTDEKPFVCSTCGKRFRRNQELKVHGWLHTGYKPYACPTCGSCFRLSQDLKRHQKTHEKGNEVACEECGNTFSQIRYLRNHLKTHRKAEMKMAAAAAAAAAESNDMVDTMRNAMLVDVSNDIGGITSNVGTMTEDIELNEEIGNCGGIGDDMGNTMNHGMSGNMGNSMTNALHNMEGNMVSNMSGGMGNNMVITMGTSMVTSLPIIQIQHSVQHQQSHIS